MKEWDIAVFGAGPAGLSAAIAARRRDKSVCVLAPEAGSALEKAELIVNYPGFESISGRELLTRMARQAEALGAERLTGMARGVMAGSKGFTVQTEQEIFRAKKLILCLGAKRPKPLPGESEYLGQGVSTCATCDGMLYRGKKMLVIGYSASAVEEAQFLAGLGDVTYLAAAPHDTLIMGEKATRAAVRQIDRLPDGTMRVTAEEGEFTADVVFVLRDAIPMSQLFPKLAMEGAFIAVNRHMETNLPGVYAAGDCTGLPLQVAKAVGEGCVAALRACEKNN